jgi:hypothetical protein
MSYCLSIHFWTRPIFSRRCDTPLGGQKNAKSRLSASDISPRPEHPYFLGTALRAGRIAGRALVIQVRADDLRADASGLIVIEAIKRVADDLAKGAVVTVEPGRSRVTLLPFRQG